MPEERSDFAAPKDACGIVSKQEFFDARASEWESRDFSQEELAKVVKLKRRLGDLQGLTVFEPGCGTGRLTRLLAEWAGARGRVIAVDDSPSMVEAAARAVRAAAPPAEIHRARAEEMPVPDGSCDLAILFCVFPHFDDQPLALRRFSRMLKDDGRLVIAHLMGSERLNALHEGAGEPVRKDRIPPRPALLEMLSEAGLRVRSLIDTEDEFFLDAAPLRDRRASER
jgi:SAM-dependent methyltransferase